ncbi:MAG: O-antigen ligase family protein [Paludibacteraceae bacterium]|nr:O-antigen ligase family protein [Paludibacteraceae bacterium]
MMFNFSRIHLSNSTILSFIMGIMLGIPFVYPSVPYYWFAFFVFFFAVLFFHKNLNFKKAFLVFFAMFISIISSFYGVSFGSYNIDPLRIAFTTAFFAFFIFGELVPDKAKLILGYVVSLNVISIAVIVAVIIIWPFKSGLLFFSMPELRLWGAPYFPDWPNFLAFMLSLAFLFNILVYKNNTMALVNISAALLTTSRTPLIAVAIVVLLFLFRRNKSIGRVFLKVVLLTFFAAIVVFMSGIVTDDFIARLLIVSDRATVYGHALAMIKASPLIGHGAVLFDSSVGLEKFASFHNSYLDITVRHGVLGLLIFLILIWPKSVAKEGLKSAYWGVVIFFLIAALFQNFFKHPHLIMMFSVILATRGIFR